MNYPFIAEYRQEYPMTTMCRVLEVSVSGYYAWRITPVKGHHLSGERPLLSVGMKVCSTSHLPPKGR